MRRFSVVIVTLAIILVLIPLITSLLINLENGIEISGAASNVGTVGVNVVSAGVCGNGICESGEDCSNCPSDCGTCPSPAPSPSPAGGGGGGISIVRGFTVEPDFIKVSLRQGETITRTLGIYNHGGSTLNFEIDLQELRDFILLSDEFFTLKPGESKILTLDFTAAINEKPDVYADLILIKTRDITKSVRTIIEVESREAILDVNLSVLDEYKVVSKGDVVKADIVLSNLGDLKPIDVFLNYAIKDFYGNVLTQREESLKIEDFLRITRELKLPENAPEGSYVFYTKVLYENTTAIGSDLFDVREIRAKRIEFPFKSIWIWLTEYYWVLLIILIIILIYLNIRVLKKKQKRVVCYRKKRK